MPEFFITARSFAAPFFSDESTKYVEAEDAPAALEAFAAAYKHPCGLYAAEAWASADAHHKGEPWVAQWLSNHAEAKVKATAGRTAYSLYSQGPDSFDINGERTLVKDPKKGHVFVRDDNPSPGGESNV